METNLLSSHSRCTLTNDIMNLWMLKLICRVHLVQQNIYISIFITVMQPKFIHKHIDRCSSGSNNPLWLRSVNYYRRIIKYLCEMNEVQWDKCVALYLICDTWVRWRLVSCCRRRRQWMEITKHKKSIKRWKIEVNTTNSELCDSIMQW